MEDKLVTLAILTYTKAQILKNVLENEGIETYIHNVNQIQPVVSSGVRLRIKESDLPRALKITESSTWLSESIVGEKEPKVKDKSNKILIPVDFSNYSMKACEFAFNLANQVVHLLAVVIETVEHHVVAGTARPLVGGDLNLVGAHGLHQVHHLLGGALGIGHQNDDRSQTDDDAQHGEKGAALPGADGLGRQFNCLL